MIGRGETETMIASGLVQNLIPKQRNGLSEERVYQILIDHRDTLEGLFEFIKSGRPLTVSDIRQFHQTLMSSVDEYEAYFLDPSTQRRVPTKVLLEKGKFKTEPNNPTREDGSVHEYCPPLEVDAEMRRLVVLFKELEVKSSAAIADAAWLHHAFSQIHPFQDGNGRVARVLASFVLIKGGLAPLIVTISMRNRYLAALEAADHGKPDSLLYFFCSCQLRQAVRLWHQLKRNAPDPVEPGASVRQILAAANAQLEVIRSLLPAAWGNANEVMQFCRKATVTMLSEYANEVDKSVRAVSDRFNANCGNTGFPAEQLSVAWNEEWGEGFSLADVGAEVLQIQTSRMDQIVVGFDTFSPQRKGLCGVFVALRIGETRHRIGRAYFISFGHLKNTESFESWLRELLNEALRMWQAKLV